MYGFMVIDLILYVKWFVLECVRLKVGSKLLFCNLINESN